MKWATFAITATELESVIFYLVLDVSNATALDGSRSQKIRGNQCRCKNWRNTSSKWMN